MEKKDNPVFTNSINYWEQRYANGRTSGAGSYNKLASFKAQVINSFVEEKGINTILEFGCGDGNQLSFAKYPKYVGLDVSQTAIELCKKRFQDDLNKTFYLVEHYTNETAELALSLDVIYHLVEDCVYDDYMRKLFNASENYVIIYSSNFDSGDGEWAEHVRHRHFSTWVDDNAPNWKLISYIKNKYPYTGSHKTGTLADFYIYKRTNLISTRQ
ncbi:hypothetical protein L3Q72_23305 [Vibrio sp. JC009]|uniref:methyltransferase domain-containing protein n=1 Tax=Vibrio sp. JC009 TaxID=2912314 RepID=UPI0023AE8A67|nr:methyltransferase domain-containing protein [Vibrio sp. JC009]WED24158.1 hypothetical protein L3Q72_23305 [Vibrio sp. JC009]